MTGATGLLGANLAHLLCKRGDRVRALVRARSDRRGVRGLPLEEVEGDVLEPASLDRAMSGIQRVYHCAGLVRFDAGSAEAVRRANVEGTRNVVAAARRAGVARVLCVSSAAAVRQGSLNEPGTEDLAPEGPPRSAYQESKVAGEAAAREAAAGRVELVTANPALVLGAHDARPSTGALLLAVARGVIAGYPAGGTNAVNAEDAAAGLTLVMERGRPGERYLLGGENLTFRELLTIAAEEAGVAPPRVLVPDLALAVAEKVASAAFSLPALKGLDPGAAALPGLAHPSYVSSMKAMRELGYRPRGIRLGIRDALRWFQEEGVLPRDMPLAPRGVLARSAR
ncbi:MAG TPA: NAD-dependent epimerase/dehydratase family protein [Myxococcaceae bacterium]